MPTVIEITNKKDLFNVKERWKSLVTKSHFKAPYFQFIWYCTALQTIDYCKTPLLLFFKEGEADIAFAPLVYEKVNLYNFSYYLVSFISCAYTPYQGLVYSKSFEKIIISLVEHLENKFDSRFILDLSEMRLQPGEAEIIENLGKRRFFLLDESEGGKSRYLKLNTSFALTLGELKKKTQKEFRRKLRRISELGDLELERIKGPDAVARHLDSFFQLYARTWKGEEPHTEFYSQICAYFDQNDKLYFYCLTIDNKPVAYLISILSGNILYGIKTTYDPSFYAFSPGVVLFFKCIEKIFEIGGVEEFDIGRGDEQFKREWTECFHEQVCLEIYPHTFFWRGLNYMRFACLPVMKKNRVFNKCYLKLRSGFSQKTCSQTVLCNKPVETVQKRIELNPALNEQNNHEELYARYAQNEDVCHLAVAMASRTIKEINERFEKMQCVLMLRDSQVAAYFWLTLPNDDTNQGGGGAEIVVHEWGVDTEKGSELKSMCIDELCMFLQNNNPECSCITMPANEPT